MALPSSFIITPRNGTLQNGLRIKKTASSYSPYQVFRWLSCIGYKGHITGHDVAVGGFPATLENLHLLSRLQLVAFPYENITMHYTSHHSMDVTPQGLYQRMVIDRQGSYCFGLNGLFLQMLRGLGYRAYSGSARINLSALPSALPNYTSLVHMVIFVQPLENSCLTYLVDVGCGGSGLARPILLSDADENVIMGTSPTEKHRLTQGVHPESSLESFTSKSVAEDVEWRLEVLHEKPHLSHATWKVVYSFSETEYFPVDFESSSFAVSMSQGGLFWDNVICSKHFRLSSGDLDDINTSENDSIMEGYLGRVAMEGGIVRQHIGSHSEVIKTVSTELERAEALREIFGLNIADDDVKYIEGRDAALVNRSQGLIEK